MTNSNQSLEKLVRSVRQNIRIGSLAVLVLVTSCAPHHATQHETDAPSAGPSPDPVIAGWMDTFSIIPPTYRQVLLIERYEEILPAATAGDSNAQYELAQIYNFCWRIPDESMQKRLIAAGMPAGSMKYFAKSKVLCEGFTVAFEGWREPSQAVRYWTDQALSQTQPMAIAEKSLKDYRDWMRRKEHYEKAGEVLQSPNPLPSAELMHLALARGVEHPEILGYAIRLAYRYFRVFKAEAYMASQGYDPTVGKMKRGPLREAWSILGCYSLPSCTLPMHLDGMRRDYSDEEIEEAVLIAVDLYNAIITHQWDQLGLED